VNSSLFERYADFNLLNTSFSSSILELHNFIILSTTSILSFNRSNAESFVSPVSNQDIFKDSNIS
jgi:hypothetical protein